MGGDWGLQVSACPSPAHVEGAGEACLLPLMTSLSGPVRACAYVLLLYACECTRPPLSPAKELGRKKKGSPRMMPPTLGFEPSLACFRPHRSGLGILGY